MTNYPTVGRVVHYVSYGTPGGEYASECRAAVVTEVDDEQAADGTCVGLAVLNPTGMFFNQHVCQHDGEIGVKTHKPTGTEVYARTYRGGTWHWPERYE